MCMPVLFYGRGCGRTGRTHAAKKKETAGGGGDPTSSFSTLSLFSLNVQAEKVTRHLKRAAAAGGGVAGADDDGTGVTADRFVWGKKIEASLRAGADVASLTAAAEAGRAAERAAEIEAIKRRREEREAEKAAREEEAAATARAKAAAEGAELDAKEEAFHRDQAKHRAAARLSSGRATPADILAKDLHLIADPATFGRGFEPEAAPPHALLSGLDAAALADLADDVRGWAALDGGGGDRTAGAWWAALVTVIGAELERARSRESRLAAAVGLRAPAHSGGRDDDDHPTSASTGLHAAVDADVDAMLAGKSTRDLERLEAGVADRLADPGCVDPGYWAAVRARLGVARARAWLTDAHARLVDAWEAARARDERFEEEGEVEEEGVGGEVAAAAAAAAAASAAAALLTTPAQATAAAEAAAAAAQSDGRFSPPPADASTVRAALAAGAVELTSAEDARLLALLRAQARFRSAAAVARAGGGEGGAAAAAAAAAAFTDLEAAHAALLRAAGRAPRARPTNDADAAADAYLAAAAAAAMGGAGGDAAFGGEVAALPPASTATTAAWHAQFRPRKPRYVNRVHTGYDWTRYNRTHYDKDAPPPKVVQGYKFNLFYPDLPPGGAAPSYRLQADPTAGPQRETVLLRFSAGPPYEDVAFRIINKAWDTGRHAGFRCTFEKGVLHLFFMFQRARYRR